MIGWQQQGSKKCEVDLKSFKDNIKEKWRRKPLFIQLLIVKKYYNIDLVAQYMSARF